MVNSVQVRSNSKIGIARGTEYEVGVVAGSVIMRQRLGVYLEKIVRYEYFSS